MDRKERGSRKGNKSMDTTVSIANVALTIFLKRPTSSGPPGAGCKVIVLLNLLVLIYSCGKTCSANAPRQSKRKNCELPKIGGHSQLPIALMLQTLQVLQILRQ